MANISADFFLAFASALQRLEDLLELASESFHLMRNAHWCCGKSPVHLVIVQKKTKKHSQTQQEVHSVRGVFRPGRVVP